MLIDWFTIVAQTINFLILVWLMKRFLYKPILNAIDAREAQVAAELANAAAQMAEAQQERGEFEQKNAAFDQEQAALLRKATDEAQAEYQRLFNEARQAAVTLRAKQQETLRSDAHTLQQAFSRRTQQEVFAIARKTLTDLAETSLEERMGVVFTRRLGALDDQAKASLAEALKMAPDPALVRSAFELPTEQRAVIQTALNETFSAEVPLRFETAPALISGIELTANGQKLAWSIADYLTSLEKGVDELLQAQEKPEAKPKSEPAPNSVPKSVPKPDPTLALSNQ